MMEKIKAYLSFSQMTIGSLAKVLEGNGIDISDIKVQFQSPDKDEPEPQTISLQQMVDVTERLSDEAATEVDALESSNEGAHLADKFFVNGEEVSEAEFLQWEDEH
ncbi:hypothetical protein [Alkanindiges illinoisensis]|uniref:Uncharacterized protein n=1 Tax=Alkanindiges illinoisensis TaxID=197183 RepID=A0A4Y7X8L8_9GAMM|nr:hypothetical protein [Alkanindiges illinoisensis]TEU23344.1 hypothetical protein E2B99_13580 [Alkanindiges illinoisensis]